MTVRMTPSARVWRLSTYRGVRFWLGSSVWFVLFVFPLLVGVLIQAIFGEIERHGMSRRGVVLIVLLGLAQTVMNMSLAYGHRMYMGAFQASSSLAQVNMLHAQTASGGTHAGPRTESPSESVSRFRDDTRDTLMYADNWLDLIGSLAFAVFAVVLLARIHVWATVVAIVPLTLIVIANRLIGHAVRRARRRSREATSTTTAFLGAVIGSSLSVKVAGAQPGVLARLRTLNDRRGRLMVRDESLADAMFIFNVSIAHLCLGLSLAVASSSAAGGGLSLADLSLFAVYVFNLVWLPLRLGQVIVGHRRFQVSIGRLDALVAPPTEDNPDALTVHRTLPLLGGGHIEEPSLPLRLPLGQLDVDSLVVAARGFSAPAFTLSRGSLTIVTGPVGSGKSTLLRALIGALEADEATVRWNGALIADRAAFFVPPNCAYVPQVPRLFAGTLAENIVLHADARPLADAMRMAALDVDVEGFPDGTSTVIGTRGVRLSGGQAQRAAAARAFVHDAELLVIDDLTSALDVETERAVWSGLRGRTVLAASTRPLALAMADQVITLR